MNQLEIYPRFKDLLPPLTKAEFEQLEQSVVSEGIREPIKVWQNKIVDGHNRYELAQSYDLPFTILDLHFEDEDSVCEWMIVNQLGRRNLEPNIKTLFIGQLYELQKKRVGAPEGNQNAAENNYDTVSDLNTAEKIAEQFEVSPRTVARAAKVHQAFEKADDETKVQFKKGEISQKKLVESATPKTEDPFDPTRYDDFTNLCKHYGNGFLSRLKDLSEFIEQAQKSFNLRGKGFENFGQDILGLEIQSALKNAVRLRNIIKCDWCAAKGCDQCTEGYLGGI